MISKTGLCTKGRKKNALFSANIRQDCTFHPISLSSPFSFETLISPMNAANWSVGAMLDHESCSLVFRWLFQPDILPFGWQLEAFMFLRACFLLLAAEITLWSVCWGLFSAQISEKISVLPTPLQPFPFPMDCVSMLLVTFSASKGLFSWRDFKGCG